MNRSNLFADLKEPPDEIFESEETDQKNGSPLSPQEDSLSSSPLTSTVPMKNYASDSKRSDNSKHNSKASRRQPEQRPGWKLKEHDNEEDDPDSERRLEKVSAKQGKTKSDPATPPLRRSSRPNKGIGKEIFDPSYIPMSHKKSLDPPKRFDSPCTDQSLSPVPPTTLSPGRGGRIVVGCSPRRRKVPKAAQVEAQEPPNAEAKSISTKKKEKGKTKERRPHDGPKAPISKVDFSDDDDNVPLKQLKEEEDSSSSSSSSDDDSDDSYNNPDRLWCICKKPHNNRFMISCDQCEEWYHGDCVGITLQRGKKMEENNEEYVCPKCVKNKYENDSSYKPVVKEPQRRKSTDSTKDMSSFPHKRSVALDEKLRASGKTLKGYALLGQIQRSSSKPSDSGEPQRKRLKVFPDGRTKHDTEQGKTISKSRVEDDQKAPTSRLSSRKCIVMSCENDALPGSVYCSNQCILRHAKESLKTISKEKSEEKKVKVPKELRDGTTRPPHKDPKKRIPVICKKTQKILTGPNAPYRRDLSMFFKQHPSYEIYRPHSHNTNSEKARSKSQSSAAAEGTKSSIDFYRHVESQSRKRDRYGADPEFSPQPKKISDSTPQRHHLASNVVKIAGPSPVNQQKPSNQSASSTKPSKSRSESLEAPRKHETAKSSDRRDSRGTEVKRKSSTDVTSARKGPEDKSKKVERSHSGGSAKGSGATPKPEVKTSSTSDIRQNIRKSLFDILKSRSSSSEDLKMHHDSITRLATKIEESLFKVYTDTTTKYKNKYRSIMFNLKDTRNHGLWRKVIIGEVTTSELVQMTAEQMASKKLAEWRRNELTQELDIIQKQEKEKANIRPVAKITHKGEIAIQENLSDLTDNINRNTSSAPTVAPARKKRISLSEEDLFDVSAPLPSDTTHQHQDHLFDLNCKICTGKVKEENVDLGEAPPEARKKVKRSTSIILSTEAQQTTTGNPSSSPPSSSAPTSHIVISEQPRQKRQKSDSVEESDIKSHDRSLSPASFLSGLSQEKHKKKKPVLPAPPPLSDISDRTADPETPPEQTDEKDDGERNDLVKKEESSDPSTPEETKQAEKKDPSPKPSKSTLIWSGSISMLELSTFRANIYPVNGSYDNLDIDLPVKLALGGRIHPKVVWEYLGKVSNLPTKQLSVVRFHAAADEDRVGYVAMLSYFSSRKRFGVVNNQDRLLVKDMYLIPLLESQPIPDQLLSCSPGVDKALPHNRPSMLLGIVVRQSTKPAKSLDVEPEKPLVSAATSERKVPSDDGEEEEYVPGEDPIIKDKISSSAILLTEEELQPKSDPKSSAGGSLFERNRSLAPSLRFFMRKQSEEEQSAKERGEKSAEDDQPYSPGEELEEDSEGGDYDPADAIVQDEDEEPYDPEKMFPEEEEEYDPETAFAPISPKGNDDIPYDPEDHDKVLKEVSGSKEVEELVEKQAFIEKMQKELEEKKAKLAQVEQSLLQSTAPADPRTRVDPRLAKRAVQELENLTVVEKSTEPPKPAVVKEPPAQEPPKEPSKAPLAQELSKEPPKPVDPLQTILSVLNMAQSKSSTATSGALKIFQKPSSPPQLPDSTTKSDVEDVEGNETTEMTDSSGLVAYAVSPESEDDGKKPSRKDDRRRRSSSSSSQSSHDGHRRHRHDYESKKHRRHRRSRSPHRRGRHSPRHRRHDDRSRHDRTWNRDRRR